MQHRFAYVGTDLQDLYGIDPATIGRAATMSDAYFGSGDAAATLAALARHPRRRAGLGRDRHGLPARTRRHDQPPAPERQRPSVPRRAVPLHRYRARVPHRATRLLPGCQCRLRRPRDRQPGSRSRADPGGSRSGRAPPTCQRGGEGHPGSKSERHQRSAKAHRLEPHRDRPRRVDAPRACLRRDPVGVRRRPDAGARRPRPAAKLRGDGGTRCASRASSSPFCAARPR